MSAPRISISETSASSVAVDGVSGTEPVGIPTFGRLVLDTGSVVAQLGAVARGGRSLATELLLIATGSSTVEPAKSDWRFKDPTWQENFAYRRLAQCYVAGCEFVDGLVDERASRGRSTSGARFALNLVTSALAPTNVLAGNPAAIKRAFETNGMSLLRGVRNWVGDVRHNGGMPSTVDRSALRVGRDLALSPGAVVHRTEQAEVLQFSPTTPEVYERPLVIVPPPIGRYYFLDLQPGRSFVEYTVNRGVQTFLLSWRNPESEQRDWDLDSYAEQVLEAIDAARDITGSPDVNVVGFCAGGIVQTTVLNYLASHDDDRVHSASYAVTMLDFGEDAPIKAFSAVNIISSARRNSSRSGIISAREMGTVFNLMRPNDLVWNYWVNNYLLGNPPPVFDILSWNADGTNLPAALHGQFLEIFANNSLCEPGALSVLDAPIDLHRVKVPVFVAAGSTDHITPWQSCYQTTQLLSGPATFVLSNAGHIQSLVNPPGNPKASFYAGPEPGPDAQEWLAAAQRHSGTWWECWADWLLERSGSALPAPAGLGSDSYPGTDPAPGRYVLGLSA